jgi:trans-aconitate 2-methyltransferase
LSQAAEFSPWLGEFSEPWYFSDDEGAAARLRSAGFEQVAANLEVAPVHVSSNEEFQDYLRTFVLHRHLELLPSEAVREELLRQTAAASANDSPPWTLDYWRLNLRARKPA